MTFLRCSWSFCLFLGKLRKKTGQISRLRATKRNDKNKICSSHSLLSTTELRCLSFRLANPSSVALQKNQLSLKSLSPFCFPISNWLQNPVDSLSPIILRLSSFSWPRSSYLVQPLIRHALPNPLQLSSSFMSFPGRIHAPHGYHGYPPQTSIWSR